MDGGDRIVPGATIESQVWKREAYPWVAVTEEINLSFHSSNFGITLKPFLVAPLFYPDELCCPVAFL